MSIYIGERLKELRERRNITQVEVAENLGISAKMLSNYELNKRNPDYETLLKLCDYYNVDLNFLFGKKVNLLTLEARLSPFYDFLYNFLNLNDEDKKTIEKITELHLINSQKEKK